MDARFIQDPYSSIGVFQRNIINSMLELDTSNTYYVFANERGRNLLKVRRGLNVVTLATENLFLGNRLMSSVGRKIRIDAFFATFNISPSLPSHVRVVLQNHDFSHGVHDLSFATFVPSKLFRYLHLKSLQRADFLLANSSFTRREAEKLVKGKPIRVIYHDCDPAYKSNSPATADCSPPSKSARREIILYAGRVGPKYKNIGVLLRAFREYSKVVEKGQLVIVYNDTLRPSDRLYLMRHRLNVTLLKNLDRTSLVQLYRQAMMFVYPTSYEGFGSPILESQNSGCPLVLNSVPPLPEVAGQGALYYDGSFSDLAKKMLELRNDRSLKENLVNKGFMNAGRFDWKTTAKETLPYLS